LHQIQLNGNTRRQGAFSYCLPLSAENIVPYPWADFTGVGDILM
jgi:hypothetical protein